MAVLAILAWIFICKNAKFLSMFASMHSFIACYMDFIQASTCPFLWMWYDDITCSMFNLLQKFLNLSELKVVPAFGIIFFGSQYSTLPDWQQTNGHSANRLSSHLNIRKLLKQSMIHKRCLSLIWNVSLLITSHDLPGISCGIITCLGGDC